MRLALTKVGDALSEHSIQVMAEQKSSFLSNENIIAHASVAALKLYGRSDTHKLFPNRLSSPWRSTVPHRDTTISTSRMHPLFHGVSRFFRFPRMSFRRFRWDCVFRLSQSACETSHGNWVTDAISLQQQQQLYGQVISTHQRLVC